MLEETIKTVIKFPELYLGKPSLERLYAFIGGYLFQNNNVNDHCLDGFDAFVAEKYGMRTTHNWSSIIQFFSNSEREAFDTFIVCFDEFQKKKNTENK